MCGQWRSDGRPFSSGTELYFLRYATSAAVVHGSRGEYSWSSLIYVVEIVQPGSFRVHQSSPFTTFVCLLRLRSLRSEPFFWCDEESFPKREESTFSSLKTFPTSVTECDSKMLSADGQDLARHLLHQVFAVALSGHLRFQYPISYGLSFSPAAWAFLACVRVIKRRQQ